MNAAAHRRHRWFHVFVLLAACAQPPPPEDQPQPSRSRACEAPSISTPKLPDEMLAGLQTEIQPPAPRDPGDEESSPSAPPEPISGVAWGLDVQFSHAPGFHRAPFELELASKHADAQVYYTLDGSVPDPESTATSLRCGGSDDTPRWRQTLRYEGPIDLAPLLERPNLLSRIQTSVLTGSRAWSEPARSVEKGVVVRAVAVHEGQQSPVASGSYFVASGGRDHYALPVVSLSTNAEYLFDDKCGMYVPGEDLDDPNFVQRGREWESPAYFELFDPDNERVIAQQVGVRIHGGYSRRLPQKSLRLYARSEYGRSRLRYPLFDTKPQSDFKRLLLRNGGNDWSEALVRDSTFQGLVRHRLETQHAQPAVVFINGEYWGLHFIRDRLDEFHVERRFGVPREDVAILDKAGIIAGEEVRGAAEFHQLVEALTEGHIATARAIDQHVDLPNLLDYAVSECYAGNNDWPHNNLMLWRYTGAQVSAERGPYDGRWRTLLFDVDRTLGRNPGVEFDAFTNLFQGDSDAARRLFHGVIQVADVRHDFIQRMAVHLETTFHPRRVRAAIDESVQRIEAELPEHIDRWSRPRSMQAFYTEIDKAYDFAERRPQFVRGHVQTFFEEVGGTAKLRLRGLDDKRKLWVQGVEVSSSSPGVYAEDDVWEAQVFAGVPLVIQTDDMDLTGIDWLGEPQELEIAPSELRLMLEPDTSVLLELPG